MSIVGKEQRSNRQLPTRAAVLTVLSLVTPVVGTLLLPPDVLQTYGALLLIPVATPPFIFGFYQGFKGTITALAASLLFASLAAVIATTLGRDLPVISFPMAVGFVGLIVGIALLSELLHREREEVESLAFTDLLTRLPNRRHAGLFLENEFAAAERGRTLSVVLFDLDHFKSYNDRWGHQMGDQALEAFADILVQNTRRMNLSGRLGGEEFVSVLAGSDGEGALAFAERVRTAMRNLQLKKGSLTVSAGVATYHASMTTPDELLAAADHALYRAKRDGRDCVRIFGRTLLSATLAPDSGPQKPAQSDEPAIEEESSAARPRDTISEPRSPTPVLPDQITEFGKGRRLLVVEDEESVQGLIRRYLEHEGFHVETAGDVPTGISLLNHEFDVVVTDLRLPGQSGTELIRAAKSRWPDTEVIAVTGMNDPGVAAQALTAGADGYLFKPFEMTALRGELIAALTRRDEHKRAKDSTGPASEEEVERAEEARVILLEGARSLVRAIEVRDPYANGHAERVSQISLAIASHLPDDHDRLDLNSLALGCELHDVGKVGIQASLLGKPGPLEPDERQEIERHPMIGRTILSPLLGDETILAVVGWHHERWDGSGYPDGLMGETIPLAARIAAVADVLDALTRPRSYRGAQDFDTAVNQLHPLFGSAFDPGLQEPFVKASKELAAIVGRERALVAS